MRGCSSERISYPPGEELKRDPAQKRKKTQSFKHERLGPGRSEL